MWSPIALGTGSARRVMDHEMGTQDEVTPGTGSGGKKTKDHGKEG